MHITFGTSQALYDGQGIFAFADGVYCDLSLIQRNCEGWKYGTVDSEDSG